MHIIINAIGSSGDINPLIVVGRLLKERGHQVDFLASPHFEAKVVRQGLNLLPLGTLADYQQALSNPAVWKLPTAFPAVWQTVMKASLPAYELIERHHSPGKTLLIGTSMAVSTRLAQEKLNLPLATIHLSPAVLLSSYDAPQLGAQSWPVAAPLGLRQLFVSSFENFFLDPICKPGLNSLRKQLGLPPVSKIITKWIHSPELVVCAFPEWFAGAQKDWPANCYNADFPLYTSEFDSALPEDLEEFLNAGPPPILVTAGTAMAFAGPLLRKAVEVSLKMGRRCLMLCEYEDQLPASWPDSVKHVRYANFHALFPRVELVIHHGGIGTAAMAVSCGVPQLIAPFAHDQFDNAMRLESLGLGRLIRNVKSTRDWCRSIEILQEKNAKMQAEEYAQMMNLRPGGALRIVEILEEKLLRNLH